MKLETFIKTFGWNTAGDFQSVVWKRTADLENCLVIELTIWPFWLPTDAREANQILRLVFRNVVSMRIAWSDLGTELDSLNVHEVSSTNWCRSVPATLVSVDIQTDMGETQIICHEAFAETGKELAWQPGETTVPETVD